MGDLLCIAGWHGERRYDSAQELELCELALLLWSDEGSPSAWCYARAAERIYGHRTITDEAVLERLAAAGICADCYRELDGEHQGCAP